MMALKSEVEPERDSAASGAISAAAGNAAGSDQQRNDDMNMHSTICAGSEPPMGEHANWGLAPAGWVRPPDAVVQVQERLESLAAQTFVMRYSEVLAGSSLGSAFLGIELQVQDCLGILARGYVTRPPQPAIADVAALSAEWDARRLLSPAI